MLVVVFVDHLAYLQRFFLKFITFQILLQQLMAITSHSLRCKVQPQLKPHRPSFAKRTRRAKSLPFVASVQHVRNVRLMIQCEECCMWCLLHSPRKLSSTARQELVGILDDYTFTCGATLGDLELSGNLSDVYVRDVQCYNPLEKLYYHRYYRLRTRDWKHVTSSIQTRGLSVSRRARAQYLYACSCAIAVPLSG